MIIFCLKPNGKAKQVIKGDCERKKQNMASNEGHEWGGSNLKASVSHGTMHASSCISISISMHAAGATIN